MQVIFSVPMLGIRQNFGMSVGEFTTKHLRSGNYIFDTGEKGRRFIPQAMCLLEEYPDDEWAKIAEEAKKKREEQGAAQKKAQDDAAKKQADDKAVADANRAALAAWDALPWWKLLFKKAPGVTVGPFKG